MSKPTEWSQINSTDSELEVICKLSRYYGSDPSIVLAGGGNTSCKIGDRLFVKASGTSLATITSDGFLKMDRTKLDQLVAAQLDDDPDTREAQYKAAISENETSDSNDLDKGITMGLFNYPILMAADILMFSADIVPVGQDQKQHIEMTRDIANRFNHNYGNLLNIPEAQISNETGILPGLDGRKMSKSYNNTIPIFSEEKQLRKSIMKIQTNSLEPGEPKNSSECNIFKIYSAIASPSSIKEFQKLYDDGIGWGEAKTILFEELNGFLKPFKDEYDKIIKDRGYVESVLIDGAARAKEVSTPLIEKIR